MALQGVNSSAPAAAQSNVEEKIPPDVAANRYLAGTPLPPPGKSYAGVKVLQTQLHAMGLYNGPLDGKAGPGTQLALQRCPSYAGFKPEGVEKSGGNKAGPSAAGTKGALAAPTSNKIGSGPIKYSKADVENVREDLGKFRSDLNGELTLLKGGKPNSAERETLSKSRAKVDAYVRLWAEPRLKAIDAKIKQALKTGDTSVNVNQLEIEREHLKSDIDSAKTSVKMADSALA